MSIVGFLGLPITTRFANVYDTKPTKTKDMTTPTTNLLKWIDEINNSIFALQASEIELKMLAQFRARILQEVENEKAVIVAAHEAMPEMPEYDTDESSGELYYRKTFNPNNDGTDQK